MSYDERVTEHYTHGALLTSIQESLVKLGITPGSVTIEDLAPVDEFHIGGRLATDNLLDQLRFSEKDHIVDVGCGLGGPSRFIADKLGNRVTGIDLTQEYIDVGNVLCRWVGLDDRVTLHQGSALSMPFEDGTFDGAIMLHVGMNIDDKSSLFDEIYRVLRPGTAFGVYDVMQIAEGELTYPVPWATQQSTSKLGTPDQYHHALSRANFSTSEENVRSKFALDFFKKMLAKSKSDGGLPPLGLHTLMQESTAEKVKNMIGNIQAGVIAPVEIIARKP